MYGWNQQTHITAAAGLPKKKDKQLPTFIMVPLWLVSIQRYTVPINLLMHI